MNKKLFFEIVIFVFLIEILGVISISFISAGEAPVFTGSTGGEFNGDSSYVFSSSQTIRPGYSSFGYYEVYPGYDRTTCEARQDFIIQIQPGGCSPAVVRSDLLAEQNVVVFCKLSAFQMNPAITIDRIKDISFPDASGNGTRRPAEIADIGYYRPSLKTSINGLETSGFPYFDNAGYLVIKLKRQTDERNLSSSVAGNLTARITYDISSGFGLGLTEKMIPVISDEQWDNDYINY